MMFRGSFGAKDVCGQAPRAARPSKTMGISRASIASAQAKNSEMNRLRLPRPLALLALLPLLLGCGGCCSLARLFCGPDTSDWEQIAYDTPPQTVATLLAALRRDNIEQVRRCLTERYQDELGITSLSAQLVHNQLHRDLPYLYMVGYAPVPQQPTSSSDRGCSFEIEANGKQVRLDLVRQSYTRILYEEPPPPGETAREETAQERMARQSILVEAGEVLPHDSWNGRAVVLHAADGPFGDRRSTVDLEPILFEHGAISKLSLEQLHLVALGREWKIDRIQIRE
jgi:hypothetical protein